MSSMLPEGRSIGLPRREFLQLLGAGALNLGLGDRAAGAGASAVPGSDGPSRPRGGGPKRIRGVFPIGETPFTPDNRLDLESLAAQVTFCNRGGVPGFMWPQLASGWTTLTESERLAGAEAILAAGKGGAAALVIGVQGPDLAAVTRYARHAVKNGADALICLPPQNVTDEAVLLDFYQQVGGITELPLFVQCIGTMSIGLVVEMYNTIPTVRQVKDEAGVPLERIAELRRKTDDRLAVFSGQGVRTMISEMELGFAGHCPYTGLADVYAAAYDLWQANRRQEAFDMFGRILAFGSLGVADQNRLLIARGVFKPNCRFRTPPAPSGSGGAGAQRPGLPLSDEGVRHGLDHYLKPHLRA